jgi:Ca-activated chloride channel family protein
MTASLNIELNATRAPWNEVFVVASITATNGVPPAPLNIGLVLDSSGSMNHGRLRAAKRAAEAVIHRLGDNDVLSIVSFSDHEWTHLERCTMTPANKRRAVQAMRDMKARGNTNLTNGWLHGATCVASLANNERYQNSVIVLSDGEANRGELNLETLAEHADALRTRGLFTSAIGIGDDYNWRYLRTLTEHGGGRMHDAETEEDIATVILGELDDTIDAVANDITLTLRHPHGANVKLLGTSPLRTYASNAEAVTSVGSLPAHATRHLIFRLDWPGMQVPDTLHIEAEADWRPRASSLRNKSQQAVLNIEFDSVPISRESEASFIATVAVAWQADIMGQLVENKRRRLSDDGYTTDIHTEFSNFAEFISESQGHLMRELHEYVDDIRRSNERSRKEFELYSYKRSRGERDKRNRATRFTTHDTTARWPEYRVRMMDERVVADIDGRSFLIETGVPTSFGNVDALTLANRSYALASDFNGLRAADYATAVGAHLDGLLGADVLSNFRFELDMRDRRFRILPQSILLRGERIPVDMSRGIPTVKVLIDGTEYLFQLNTSAKLSYLRLNVAAHITGGERIVGNEADAIAGFPPFETDLFILRVGIHHARPKLRFGKLPQSMEEQVLHSQIAGVLGSELLREERLAFAFDERCMYIR